MNVSDPVGAGYAASLARAGANTTGFTLFEYSISGKWLELLKQLAADMRRAAVIRDPSITSGTGQFAAIQEVPALGVELTPVDLRAASGIEHGIATFARGSSCGLIVTIEPGMPVGFPPTDVPSHTSGGSYVPFVFIVAIRARAAKCTSFVGQSHIPPPSAKQKTESAG